MKKARRIFAVLAFLLIFAACFFEADRILCRKETEGWWNVTAKIDGFYNSPEDEYEVMYFGSSNTYCSFNPLVVWEETGVKSYVFATQQQPLWATYYYMADAFKTQSPKLCVVDVLMASKGLEYYDDGVNYTFCDNMPFSANKVRLAKVSAPKDERFGLLCRFWKYHSRWNELEKEDFEYKKSKMDDYSKGYYVLTSKCNDAVYTDTSDVSEISEITDKNREYLEKIIELCKKSGAELMLVKTPSGSTPEQKRYFNCVEGIAKENGVLFCDYNEAYDEIGLDTGSDFFDKNHLNVYGAEKFTKYFVETTPFFAGRTRNDEDWKGEFEKYRSETKNN